MRLRIAASTASIESVDCARRRLVSGSASQLLCTTGARYYVLCVVRLSESDFQSALPASYEQGPHSGLSEFRASRLHDPSRLKSSLPRFMPTTERNRPIKSLFRAAHLWDRGPETNIFLAVKRMRRHFQDLRGQWLGTSACASSSQ
jgi:hypothetical protein